MLKKVLDEIPEGLDMTGMEQVTEDLKSSIGEATLSGLLARLGPEDGRPRACPKCGEPVPVKTVHRRRTVRTLSGDQTIHRNYHHCRKCGVGFYPRDAELGLPSRGEITYELEKRILDLALNDAYEHAAERWSVHYARPISSNLLRRVVDRVSARCEGCDSESLQLELLPRELEAPKLLIVQTDGSQLPMRGPEPWKEAKVAVLVRDDQYVSHREANRGQISEARYLAVLGNRDELRDSLETALRVAKSRGAATTVWLGDGAQWNWTLAKDLTCETVEILDWYHATEHASDCGKILFDSDPIMVSLWLQRSRDLLATGNVDLFVRELMDCVSDATDEGVKAIDALISYYRANQTRMRYDEYLEKGYPIGSGIVESAHRHVLQDRMKRAGQHWSLRRGKSMANLRAGYRTAGPKRFHAAILRASSKPRTPRAPSPDHGKLIHPGLRNRIKASNR